MSTIRLRLGDSFVTDPPGEGCANSFLGVGGEIDLPDLSNLDVEACEENRPWPCRSTHENK